MTIDLRVLRNPCVNTGICQGPETDPECTSANRTKGETIVVIQLQRFHFRIDILYHQEYCGLRNKVIVPKLNRFFVPRVNRVHFMSYTLSIITAFT